eukprot:956861_1
MNVKHYLCEYVSNAQSTNDIIPLLKLIPLGVIQNAMVEAIHDLDSNTANDMQYKLLPITQILPDDVIQYIVSFTDSLHIKCINKAFNMCYNKQRLLQSKQRQCFIDKQMLTPNIEYTTHNQTWIMHPTRTHLSSEEIAFGYKGPMNNLQDAFRAVQSGDKLLLHDGTYTESENTEFSML